jgi:hypothetical protein
MADTIIDGAKLTGVLRLTWVSDDLAHVLGHSQTDEPTGTWTGLACPHHGLALGADVETATLQSLSADRDIADFIWEAPADLTARHGQLLRAAIQAYQNGQHETGEQLWRQAHTLWSQAWSANYEALKLMQAAGLARFAPVKPQRWVIASFEHHCGPHGLPHPHVHNVVATSLTTGTLGSTGPSSPEGRGRSRRDRRSR